MIAIVTVPGQNTKTSHNASLREPDRSRITEPLPE
jgi:hypothetical protein